MSAGDNAAAQILAVGACSGGVADVFRRITVELQATGRRVSNPKLVARRTPASTGLITAVRLRRQIREAGTVHVEFGSNDIAVFWFALAACLLRRDCVVVAHDYPKLVNKPAAGLIRPNVRFKRALAYRVLSPLFDDALKSLLLRLAGVLVVFNDEAKAGWQAAGAQRVCVIEHGADGASEGDIPPPSEGITVVCAGFLGPTKGIDVLLRAWELIAPDVDLQLVLAGEPAEPWFSQTIRSYLGQPNGPLMLGPVADEATFHRLIAGAAVVVLPYRSSSPASGILMRALATGRAIVGTDVPAMAPVTDAIDGLVVPPEDHTALAEAIRRLCDDPDERDRLGRAANRLARSRFTWQAHIRGLEAAYDIAARTKDDEGGGPVRQPGRR